ncbi:MAG: hypothetical protein ACOCVF_02275 [bacterium]
MIYRLTFLLLLITSFQAFSQPMKGLWDKKVSIYHPKCKTSTEGEYLSESNDYKTYEFLNYRRVWVKDRLVGEAYDFRLYGNKLIIYKEYYNFEERYVNIPGYRRVQKRLVPIKKLYNETYVRISPFVFVKKGCDYDVYIVKRSLHLIEPIVAQVK